MVPVVLGAAESAPIVAGAVARVIPVVERTAPALFRALVARLQQVSKFAGNSVEAVLDWAKKDKVNASLIAVTMASLGMDIFSGGNTSDEKNLSSAMQPFVNGERHFVDTAAILAAGATSESLKLDIASNQRNLDTATEILSWAKGHYGSAAQAKNAHALHQAFFEMSFADVEAGFNSLRV